MQDTYLTNYLVGNKIEKLSHLDKIANDYAWYKHKANWATMTCVNPNLTEMKVNYDLANNKLNEDDFKYVVNPFDNPDFKLPARLENRDIISNKLKILEGMEMRRPFVWKVVAVNPEATTRKEQAMAEKIRAFVVSKILDPLRAKIAIQYKPQIEQIQQQGQDNPESQQQLEQVKSEIDEQLKIMTPPEVVKYMQREHQDPLEMLSQQLLTYLILDKEMKRRFNKGWKHAVRSGMEVYYNGITYGEPDPKVLNPMRFRYLKTEDTDFFEDGEAATYQYDMTFTELVTFFKDDDLTDTEIKSIQHNLYVTNNVTTINWDEPDMVNRNIGLTVTHCVWRALREVKILKYMDFDNEEKEMLVDESYQMNYELGDISIISEWISEVYETYILPNNIYKRMRPIPGQFRDITKLYYNKLPYYGGIYDDMNSNMVSITGRMKQWQYYYNIIYYKIELLMSSDKGKKLLMNVNAIPTDSGINLEQWQHFFESTPYTFFNPTEEGMEGVTRADDVAKIIDFSTVNQIDQYIQLAEKIKFECGDAVGINRQVEGQIDSNDAVYNTKQAVMQTSTLLEPFFAFHDNIKKNVLTGMLENAKVAYEDVADKKLSYVLDDATVKMFTIDGKLLQNASVGLYVQNSLKIEEIKDSLNQLAHAAMQNQQIKLSTVLSIMKEDSLSAAEETLKAGEVEMSKELSANQKGQQEHEKEMQDKILLQQREAFENQKELIVLKEGERRVTELSKTALMGASFNPDEDTNDNGINDYVELAQKFAKIKNDEANTKLQTDKFNHQKTMENNKLAHQKIVDKQKLEQENRKIAIANKKKVN